MSFHPCSTLAYGPRQVMVQGIFPPMTLPEFFVAGILRSDDIYLILGSRFHTGIRY
jgi:hypothetical protein